MKLLFLLLVIFQFKHLIADYPLQGEYMLGKFKPDWSFLGPLLAHVGVHAGFTFVIAVFLVPWYVAILLGLGDAAIHFVMDRVKAGPKYMGRWKPLTGEQWMEAKRWASVKCCHAEAAQDETCKRYIGAAAKLRGNRLFWICLGVDQMVHHLTHYGVIYFILLLK